mgnify:FL=1
MPVDYPDDKPTKKEDMLMSIYAVAKKTPYVISAEESKAIFSSVPDAKAQKAIADSARLFENTCLKKGTELQKKKEKKD